MFLVPHKKWILSSYWPWCNGSKWCWWKGSIKLMLLANANFIRKNIIFLSNLLLYRFSVHCPDHCPGWTHCGDSDSDEEGFDLRAEK